MERDARERILNQIASYHDEIIRFASDLVTVPTENPPGRAYKQCAEIITQELSAIGLKSRLVEIPHKEHPRYCILSYEGKNKRTLYFHGHYDVVPATDKNQFRPFVRGGKLFGRGSSDMKGGLAAMIYAIKALKECRQELNGTIGLTIVPDEETGGVLGSQYLSRLGLLGRKGIGMLTAEPTGGVIWNASRGAISIQVTVKGKPAHVGLDYKGVNAFERMLTIAGALVRFKKDVEKKRTKFKITPRPARRSIMLVGGRCIGGTSFNMVPDRITFTVDRRINPEENLEVEKRRLVALLNRLKRKGIDLEFEILQEAVSAGVSDRGPVAQALVQSVKEITGRIPRFQMCPGVLETRFYAKKAIPAFAYGPGLLSASHAPDEFARIRDIHRCTAIYALTAARLLG